MLKERVKLTKKPIRGVPVGGEMLLSRVHARALIAVGLAVPVRQKPTVRRNNRPK